ncbi:hypothetical protein BBB02_00405 [Wolbachia endosymbiont of Bemisia tabaci]|nr:hypothetical protein BBB02_00405 [Wolbachia endosymbiont of Bemisia tabaci]
MFLDANLGVQQALFYAVLKEQKLHFLLLKACVSYIFHNVYYVIFDTNKNICQSFKQQPIEPPLVLKRNY